MMRFLCLLGLLLAAGEHAAAGPETAVPAAPSAWLRHASEPDRKRLRQWRKTWVAARKQAGAAGHQSEIDAAGPLLDPDASLAEIGVKAGDYRCRTIKLGAKG